MTTNTATITISTTPMMTPTTALADRMSQRHSAVGVLARVIAGITGSLLGIAIGLVSAGFDTTRFLLVVGAAALALGWFFSVVIDRPNSSARRR